MPKYDFVNTKFISWFSALETISQGEYRSKKNEFKLGGEASRHFAIGIDGIGRPMIGAFGFSYEVFNEMDIDSIIILRHIPFKDEFNNKVYSDYLLFKVNRITDDNDAPFNPFSVYLPVNNGLVDNFYWLDKPNATISRERVAGFVQVEQNKIKREIEQLTPVGEEKEIKIFRGGDWRGVAKRMIEKTGVDMRKKTESMNEESNVDNELGLSNDLKDDDILDIE